MNSFVKESERSPTRLHVLFPVTSRAGLLHKAIRWYTTS